MHVFNILWMVFGVDLMLVLIMTAGPGTFPTLAIPLRLLWPVSKKHVENWGLLELINSVVGLIIVLTISIVA